MDEGLISRVCLLLMLAGAAAMLRRFHAFYLVPLGFLAAFTAFYVFLVHGIFGWYLAPFSAVNCLLLVLGLGALFRELALPERIPFLSRVACAAYVLPFLAVLPITFKAERDIQRWVDAPGRQTMGRYLLAHKKPGEAIGCEPLGYVAYYSRMPVYDYPGLASPEVTALIRRDPARRSLERTLEHFKPAWIALRESEYRYLAGLPSMRFLQVEYAVEKEFRADPERSPAIFRIGHNIDRAFFLLRKRR
jgi:hypothetical protein